MGLAYLAPIGAQNLFIINTALTAPLGIALVTAGIVAFFDISLALACFWGIGLVIEHSLYQRRSSSLLPVVLRAYRHLQNLLPKSVPQPYAMDQPHLRRRYFCLRPQTALYLWADAVKTMNTHIKKQQLFKLLLLFCSNPFNLLL